MRFFTVKKNRNRIKSIAFAAAAALLTAWIFPVNSYADADPGSVTEYTSETDESGAAGRNAGNTDTVSSGSSETSGDTVILGMTGENGTERGADDAGAGSTAGSDNKEDAGTPGGSDNADGTVTPGGTDVSDDTVTSGGTDVSDDTSIPGGIGIPDGTGTPEDTASGDDPAAEGGATGRGEAQESGNTGTVPEIVCMFNEACTRFELMLSGYEPADGGSLRAAIWSEAGGQDDLEWVGLTEQADGTYKKTVNISDFSDPGKLDIHVYMSGADGIMSYVTGISVIIPTVTEGDLVLVSGMSDGTAVISSANVSSVSGITSARAAAWSRADQSDIYWYDMKEDGSGNWTFDLDLKNHKNNAASYIVHMYAVDGNGFTRFAAGNIFDFSGLSGDLLVTVNPSDGTYITEVTGFSSTAGYKEIRAAVWTQTGGQDDISWHVLNVSGEGDYASVTSSASDFKHFGTAYAHVYVTMADGSARFLDGCEFTLNAPVSGQLTAATSEDGSFVLTLPGLQSDFPVSEVRMAVWSTADQSNLYWYTAERSDTDYVAEGSISNHKNLSGKYNVHVYVFPENAPAVFVSGTTMEFAGASGEITFTDNGRGIPGGEEKNYRLSISDVSVPFEISRLQFAVWNLADTGNIRWYTASKSPDGYYTDVPISDFRKTGQYVTHVYVTDGSGRMSYLNGQIIMNVSGTVTGALMEAGNDDPGKGTFDVTVSGASAPSGIGSMTFYVWTTAAQTDMYAYTGVPLGGGSYRIKVDIANHRYNSGKFYIHAYAVMGNGISTFAAGREYNFIASDEAVISEEARRIIASAKVTPTTPPGYCAMWISNVYANAGLPVPRGDACDMWARMATSVNNIKPGMSVAVRHSGPTGYSWLYGHIGIYIGDGLVMDSTGTVNTRPLNTWIAAYDYSQTVRCGYLL